MAFLAFMSRPIGRLIRVVVGTAIIVLGVAVIGGVAGAIVAVAALAPLLTGVFGICPICYFSRTSCALRT